MECMRSAGGHRRCGVRVVNQRLDLGGLVRRIPAMSGSAHILDRLVSRFGLTRKARLAARDARSIPTDLPREDREIVTEVRPFSMTSPMRVIALIEAVRYIVRNEIPGALVECGVWRGGSMMAAAMVLQAEGDSSRDLYLYDTYEGMSEPTEQDAWLDGTPAAELLARSPRGAKIWARASLEDVRENMRATGYPEAHTHLIPGRVEDTIPAAAPDSIALLRLDTDWYESTRHELEHLYPRLARHGVLIIDDYGRWKGSRKATDEYFETASPRPFLARIDEGRVIIKP